MLDPKFDKWLRKQPVDYLNFLYGIYTALDTMNNGKQYYTFSIFHELQTSREPLIPVDEMNELLAAIAEPPPITLEDELAFKRYLNEKYPNAPKE